LWKPNDEFRAGKPVSEPFTVAKMRQTIENIGRKMQRPQFKPVISVNKEPEKNA
jgi:hypothetical protein